MTTDDDILERINVVLQDVLGDPSVKATAGSTAADFYGWDSLSNIRIMIGVERAFKIRVSAGEVKSLSNVGELVGLVHAKLGGASRG